MSNTNDSTGKTTNEQIAAMKKPPVVSADEWQKSWEELLVKEKELTRTRDAMAAARRRMPWLAVEKEYVFEGPKGKRSLLEIWGPLFMSNPAVSNLQYRLTEENGVTRMRFVHRAMGWIGENERGVHEGWTHMIERIRTAVAERKGR